MGPVLRWAPPHTGSPGPFGPEPRKSPKRVRKEYPGAGPQKCPKSAPWSLKRVRKKSESQILDSFRTLLRHSLGTFGALPQGTLPDSFRTLPGFRARRARETLCGAGPTARPVPGNQDRKEEGSCQRDCSSTFDVELLHSSKSDGRVFIRTWC